MAHTLEGQDRARRSVAWSDALGAAALMAFVVVCGGLGVGLAVVLVLELLGMPLHVDAGAILNQVFGR